MTSSTVSEPNSNLSNVWLKVTDLQVVRGLGCRVYDADDNAYLDFTAGIAAASTGHCHPKVVQAIADQAQRFVHAQANIYTHDLLQPVAARLAELTPESIDTFFFSNSSDEILEAAVKLAKHATGRRNIITFDGAFHGRTLLTMAMSTSRAIDREGYGPFPSGVFVAPFPDPHASDQEAEISRALRGLDRLFQTQVAAHEVAAIIIEPVIGERGYIPTPRAFIEGLDQRCRENGILFVADETQSGFGRTGKMFAIEEHDIAGAPAWVDRVQPKDFVVEQLDDWGKYVRGWWNSLFSRLDVIQTTPGMSLVYGSDGRTSWYTGMQSAGADDGTVGFVLVDTRTKKVRWYRMPGAMETSAQSAAENARGVREAGFEATFPVLYNIGGVPTYLTTLKGDDGLVKMFGFVSAQNLMVVGVDSTIQDALRNYQNSLQQQGRTLVADDLVKQQRLEAEVLAIARERRGDIEYYYLILKGREDTEFYAAPELSPELKWTRVGDTVAIDFDEGKLRSVLINTFDNPRLALVMAP